MYIEPDNFSRFPVKNESNIAPSRARRFWNFLKNIRIEALFGAITIAAAGLFFLNFILKSSAEIQKQKFIPPKFNYVKKQPAPVVIEEKPEFKYVYKPVPIDWKNIQNKGCVADGLLSEYSKKTDKEVAMINRSECLYLHRALETWAMPPDFQKASEIMKEIKKPGIVYGMFIAEAIRRTQDDFYEEWGQEFDFADMCRDESENAWGEHTCKPTLQSKEYRRYLKYITRKAMDLGIQSFLFGQINYQDTSDLSKSKLPEVLDDMRAYAKEKNIEIIIGAQTGTITDETYLRRFDYIEGGVGIGEDGQIENGPCWSHLESCWALLWHDNYAQKTNHVLLHLDWSGLQFDDMSVFARMEKNKRAEVLKNLYSHFTSKNMGFLMPMMATLYKENGGCYGSKKGQYSASRDYSCQDEKVINNILSRK